MLAGTHVVLDDAEGRAGERPTERILLVRRHPADAARVHPLATLIERVSTEAPTHVGRRRYRLELPLDPDTEHMALDERRAVPELGTQPASKELCEMATALAGMARHSSLTRLVDAVAEHVPEIAWWELESCEQPEQLDLALRRILAPRLLDGAPELRRLALAHLEPGQVLEPQTIEVGPGPWCLVEPHRLAAIGRDSTPPARLESAEIEAMTEAGILVGARASRAMRMRVGPPLGRAAAAATSLVAEFHLRLERGRLALIARESAPRCASDTWVSVPAGEHLARLSRVGPVGRRLLGADLVLELGPATRRGLCLTELPAVD